MSKARELANLGNAYSDGALSNRNLIINGGMAISQRYGTASSNLGGSSVFAVDRFNCFGPSASSTSTAQQVTDTPAGFKNSLKYTCGTGLSVTGGDYAQITQIVEGNNVAHLKWGTSDASDVTVSFWVKSSLTGTFSFGVQNGPTNRSYVAQYTVSTANTWEYKSITIGGDTSGTWASDNAAAMRLVWDMGFGYGATSTVDAWQAGDVHYVAGNVKVNETSGATFYITGVQLEVGDTATPFEHRSYGDELARCQRYYCHSNNLSGPPNVNVSAYSQTGIAVDIEDAALTSVTFPTMMRVVPTMVVGRMYSWNGALYKTITAIARTETGIAYLSHDAGNTGAGYVVGRPYKFSWIADAEL